MPVKVAVRDLGCNVVIGIRCSARLAVQDTDPGCSVGEVMAPGVLGLTLDELADDDVAPYGGWGDGVKVTVIRPNLNLHDPMVVAPGLIRIAMDYGWMRAADVVDVADSNRQYGEELSDRITSLRAQNWMLAHFAGNHNYRDPHRSFSDFVFAGMTVTTQLLQGVPDPGAANQVRANCRMIRDALCQRLLISAPTPPAAVRTSWFTQWELTDASPASPDPWAGCAYWTAEAAPAPI